MIRGLEDSMGQREGGSGLHLHDDALVGHQVVRALVVHFEEEVVGATGDVGREGEMELDRLPASG